MNDLEEAFWEAWKVVGPRLLADPLELARRLARRQLLTYRRPMRAECLAVRASDHRINAATAAMVPDDAAYPGRPDLWRPHDVYLDARLLRQICCPVTIEPPGELPEQVAKRLGIHPKNIDTLRRNGTLRTHYLKGLLGRRGPPVPLVFTWDMLDPSARGKLRPDPIWGALWTCYADGLRDQFVQPVRRVPIWRIRHGRDVMTRWNWVCPRCGRQARTLYYPRKAPDWGEHLVRMGAVSATEARKLGVRRDLWDPEFQVVDLGQRGAAAANVPPALVGGFGGWDRSNLAEFACKACHAVMSFSRASLTISWNALVLHYSGGLLYGNEVKRPAWLVAARKRQKLTRKSAAPRRQELTRLLVATNLTPAQIAHRLGIKPKTVRSKATAIYRRHNIPARPGVPRSTDLHPRQALRQARPDLLLADQRRAG